MVPAKPWHADAIIRLVLSVMICAYAGSVVVSVVHYCDARAKVTSTLFLPLAFVTLLCLGGALVLLSKPWHPEKLMVRMTALFVCGYGGLLLGAWVQRYSGIEAVEASLWRMAVATLSFQGAALVLIARFLREQQMTWSEAFGFSNARRRSVLLGLVAALLFLPLGWGLQEASALVMTHLPLVHMQPKEQLPIHALRVSISWGGRAALGVAAVFLAPVAEEMMFRGILYPVVKQLGYPRLALWGTALLFAAVHLNLLTFLPLAALAVVLTLLYEHTNNLLTPIITHVLFNALNFGTLLLLQQYRGP